MSELPQFSKEDTEFLTSLDREMDRYFESSDPTHEDLQTRLEILNRYFGIERRRLITNYLNDRMDAFHSAELSEQDENVQALFENTVGMIFKLDEPMYTNRDGIPVGRQVALIQLFHRADMSQNDLNMLEGDLPLRLHVHDLREAIMEIMEMPSETRTANIVKFFDQHIWSTVRRFLEFGEGQS